ncbi:MAG: DUF1624 domain-containing protein [Sandaracinaceae bacterium]|nr:DUF1624 domain-containing protein [Sandaracinaceae bacterium]
MSGRRIEGVDVARGVASLIMIQGHAYDGWVAPADKASAAYQLTRLLGSLPLPAFLVLAGAAVVLRVDAARRRGEDMTGVRRSIAKRGAAVLVYGYLTNLAYAAMDGFETVDTLLRADVLHVIGLSILALAILGVRADRRALGWAALGLAIVPTALCPRLSELGHGIEGPLRWPLGLFIDVPGVTLMPFVPLVAWVGIGALVCLAMLRARADRPLPAGAPTSFLAVMAAGALAVAWAAHLATGAVVDALGGSLSRAHPAVWANVVDLGARGVLVLAVAALGSGRLPSLARRGLVRLGQGSLVAYVFHIPFCYGRLGEPLRGRLDMTQATVAVLALMVLSGLAVHLRDRLRLVARTRVGDAVH